LENFSKIELNKTRPYMCRYAIIRVLKSVNYSGNVSSKAVLTATSQSNGNGQTLTPHRIQTP